jgi:hypothetical protein
VNASVQDYNVACNMIVVTTKSFPDLRPACLDKQMQVECCTKVLAASYCTPDKFLVTTGVVTNNPTLDESYGINWSSCEITEVLCQFLFSIFLTVASFEASHILFCVRLEEVDLLLILMGIFLG